ncbi:MAG: DUF4363 family protein [Eubacteriales bacterium]|nr:DUF4363 family protein [Eubacteriales bacterium]
MKSIYIAVAVSLVLIAGSIASSVYVKNAADKLEMRAEIIERRIEKEDFASALIAADELDRQIEKSKTLLCAVVDHKDIYEIKRSLFELRCYLDAEEEADALAHCRAIVAITEKISDNALPYVYNIL